MVGSRLQHLLARPSIARILFGLTNGEAASQPHRLQAGFFGHFQKTSLILRVPKHAFASLWDIFVSLAEILPGPGSLCFTLAGISSFIAALILLGLEKALSEVAMLAQ